MAKKSVKPSKKPLRKMTPSEVVMLDKDTTCDLAEHFKLQVNPYVPIQTEDLWPALGMPDEIYLDNGPEALNLRIQADVPPAPPWAKEIVKNAINGYWARTKKPKE